MKKDPQETDPREQLRRLDEALDEALPDEEEARAAVAALGADVPAMTARIRARAAARHAARVGGDHAARAEEGARSPGGSEGKGVSREIATPGEVAPGRPSFPARPPRRRNALLALVAVALVVGAVAAVAVPLRGPVRSGESVSRRPVPTTDPGAFADFPLLPPAPSQSGTADSSAPQDAGGVSRPRKRFRTDRAPPQSPSAGAPPQSPSPGAPPR